MGDATSSQEMSHHPVGDVLQQIGGGLRRDDWGFKSVFLGDIGVEVLCHVGRLVDSSSFSGPHPVCVLAILPSSLGMETISNTPVPVGTQSIPICITLSHWSNISGS